MAVHAKKYFLACFCPPVGRAHLDAVLEWRAVLVVAQASCLCVSGLMRPRELTGKMPVPLRYRRMRLVRAGWFDIVRPLMKLIFNSRPLSALPMRMAKE